MPDFYRAPDDTVYGLPDEDLPMWTPKQWRVYLEAMQETVANLEGAMGLTRARAAKPCPDEETLALWNNLADWAEKKARLELMLAV
jgi:hypothetical protein